MDSTKQPRPTCGPVLAGLVLVLAVLAVYARGIHGPFLYDDLAYVVGNPTIRSLSGALASFGDPAAGDDGHFSDQVYRPLIPVAYALIHAVGGMKPAAFHLALYLLHALNTVLVFVLFRRLTVRGGAAFWAAAWWGLHPVQVESVQWISGLDDVLGGTFVLLTSLLVIADRRYVAWPVFLLGLLCKETSIMAAALVFLLVFFRDDSPPAARFRTAALRTVPFAAMAVGYLIVRAALIGLTQGQGYWGGSVAATIFTMAKGLLVYFRLILLPVSLRINYLFHLEHGMNFASGIGFALILVAGVVAWLAYRRRPLITLGILWFFCFFAPVSNLFPIYALVNERFLYVPLIGVALVGADLVGRIQTHLRFYVVTGFLILVVLAALSFSRVGVWLDEERFWKDIVDKEPGIVGFQTNLGIVYAGQKRYEEAEALFRAVLGRRPNDVEAAANLGQLYLESGRYPEALALYEQLHARRPDDPRFTTGRELVRAAMSGTDPSFDSEKPPDGRLEPGFDPAE